MKQNIMKVQGLGRKAEVAEGGGCHKYSFA